MNNVQKWTRKVVGLVVRQGIDRSTIAQAAYVLADERGLATLSIRSVAEACDVSVGTIYKYFPTKDDLIVDVISMFWRSAFTEDMCRIVPGERFDAFVVRLHDTLGAALRAFRSDWLPQISALSMQSRGEGKMRESEAFNHMRAGMRIVLESDAQADAARAGIASEELVAFVLRSMITSLCSSEADCRVLVALLRAALYDTHERGGEGRVSPWEKQYCVLQEAGEGHV